MIEYLGVNSIKNLKVILEKNDFQHIFLITGKNSFEISNASNELLPILKNFKYFRFSDFELNPKIEDIKKGLDIFNKEKYEVIVAVGGGSVIDVAKSIAIFSGNYGDLEKYVKKELLIQKKGTPLICIPTTAGSGSEATHFAVIYIDKEKFSLGHPEYIIPDYSIVDPQFTYSLPEKITASTGMDALTQAIESFWNIFSTNESKDYAKNAIKLILNNIIGAVNNPDKESRKNMAFAAHFAGKAINISKTTACHAISYPITSYFDVPHGQAVSITLPSMLSYNSEVTGSDLTDQRGLEYVKDMMNELYNLIGVENESEAKTKLEDLMQDIGLKIRLNQIGIKTQEDIELIIKNGFNPERVKNNPRRLTELNLRKILEEIR